MGKIPVQYVLNKLGLSYPTDREGFDTECPQCGHKLHVSLSKEVFHCFYCGAKGGKIALFALFKNMSFDEAKKALLTNTPQENTVFPEINLPKLNERASIEVRDKTYNELLSLLKLKEHHRANLLARGFTSERIEMCKFRSTVTTRTEAESVVKRLLARGCILRGVPGFFKDNEGNYRMVLSPNGILIPVRGASSLHRIQALQIRVDKPVKKKKFYSFSSSQRDSGTASSAMFMHFAGTGLKNGELYITEGPIKAEIANQITGKSFLALLGVTAILGLADMLQKLKSHEHYKLEKIFICLDMDYETNKEVRKALERIKEICVNTGLPVLQLKWDSNYKGIDDFLVARTRQREDVS